MSRFVQVDRETAYLLPPELGEVKTVVADNGFMSEANVGACAAPTAEDATPIQRRMELGVPCLQCEADAPDAGHLNGVGGVNNSLYYSLSAPPRPGAMTHAFTPTVDQAKSDRMLGPDFDLHQHAVMVR